MMRLASAAILRGLFVSAARLRCADHVRPRAKHGPAPYGLRGCCAALHVSTAFRRRGTNKDADGSTCYEDLVPSVSGDTQVDANSAAPAQRDILLLKLQNARSLEDIWELTRKHATIMNATHLCAAFNAIYYLSRSSNVHPSAIFSQVAFNHLCSCVQRQARFLKADDVISIFRTLAWLRVPSQAAVARTVLQMLRHQVNDLSLNHLSFLDFLLAKQQPTPLVEALKIAVPLVVETQMDAQLDPHNLNQVSACLAIGARHSFKQEHLQRLVKAAWLGRKGLNSLQALTIAQAILHLKDPLADELDNDLLHTCLDVLLEDTQTKLSHLLSLFFIAQSKHRPFFHKEFFQSIAARTIAAAADGKAIGVPELALLASSFYKEEFACEDLLRELSRCLVTNPDLLQKDPRLFPLPLARFFAQVGLQPPEASTLWPLLADSQKTDGLWEKPRLMLSFLSHLSVLGYHPHHLLKRATQDGLIPQAIEMAQGPSRQDALEEMRHLSMGLASEPSLRDALIPAHLLEEALSQRTSFVQEQRGFLLRPILESGLGGHFFLTSVATRVGHFADHAIILRGAEYPVAMDVDPPSGCGFQFLEDIPTPPGTAIIVVSVLGPDSFLRRSGHLKGTALLHTRTLVHLGYHPVNVSLETWTSLLDREKVPFLMRAIRGAVPRAAESAPSNPLVY